MDNVTPLRASMSFSAEEVLALDAILAGKPVAAKDALTGETLSVTDGQVRFPLARLRMRLVRVE